MDAQFAKMLGMFVWGVKQAHGSHIFLEFGNPKLEVREPKQARTVKALSDSVIPNFLRRRVTPVGQYQLLVLGCKWDLIVPENMETNSDENSEIWPKFFSILDGQKLMEVKVDPETFSCKLQFDLGACFIMHPLVGADPSEDQWQLKTETEGSIYYTNAGQVSYS